ncbi:MAG: NAD-dependent epimerase/dehydratase family protein [Thermoanaerobaculia bacterium]
MIALVTGASGFLGGALARRLVEEGHRVRILARPASRLDHLSDLPLEVVRGALEEPPSLELALSGARLVFHCAACSTDWAPWRDYRLANVVGPGNLAAAALRSTTLERVVHVSSTDVYGYPRSPGPESSPLLDVGLPYNRSKILGEQVLRQAAEHHGLPLTILRPATIYGPRSKDFALEIGELLLAGKMLYLDGGAAPGGFVYIDHAVDALLAAASTPQALGKVYNLTDGGSQTWRQYVEALARELGVVAPRKSLPSAVALALARLMEFLWRALRRHHRPLLTRHAVFLFSRSQAFPNRRARDELGFRPTLPFETAVGRTARWFQDQPRRAA